MEKPFWDGVMLLQRTNRVMKRGVKAGNLRNIRKGGQTSTRASNVVRLMQRSEVVELFQLFKNTLADHDGLDEGCPSMHDAMRDGMQPGVADHRLHQGPDRLKCCLDARLISLQVQRASLLMAEAVPCQTRCTTWLQSLDMSAGMGLFDSLSIG